MNNSKEKKIRAFLAIDPPESVRSQLEAAQNRIKGELQGPIRWVASQGIHLTMKFFGNIGEDDIEAISAVLKKKTMQAMPLKLIVKSIGVFPHVKRPRVIWLGTDGEVENLIALATNVETGLHEVGFPRDERSFTPHWTLGRINGSLDTVSLERLLEAYREEIWGSFMAEELVLFRSDLTPRGAIYTPLRKYKFGGEEIK